MSRLGDLDGTAIDLAGVTLSGQARLDEKYEPGEVVYLVIKGEVQPEIRIKEVEGGELVRIHRVKTLEVVTPLDQWDVIGFMAAVSEQRDGRSPLPFDEDGA